MARVTWIADARVVPGIGLASAGQILEVTDDVAASLCEQGKATLLPLPVPEPAPVLRKSRTIERPTEDEGED